jgi:hypothetical protein
MDNNLKHDKQNYKNQQRYSYKHTPPFSTRFRFEFHILFWLRGIHFGGDDEIVLGETFDGVSPEL